MAVVEKFDRITIEPAKCGGKPGIRGMRITVRRVLELLAIYPDRNSLFPPRAVPAQTVVGSGGS